MFTTRAQSISTALRRIRRGVTVCCWLTGLALAGQTIVWSLAMFTDMRYKITTPAMDGPAVVRADESSALTVRPALTEPGQPPAPGQPTAPPVTMATGTQRTTPTMSEDDARFATIAEMSSTVGIMTVLALLPLLMVGVMLAAASATPGVEKTVSALTWALLLAMLVVPVSGVVPFVRFGGTFVSYPEMISLVEKVRAEDVLIGGGMQFYVRFVLLPATCIIGLAMIGVRFSSGVEASLIPGVDPMKLDPALEEEVSRIKPSSHHSGGRTSAALRATVVPKPDPEPIPPAPVPSATQVSPGAMPRRLI